MRRTRNDPTVRLEGSFRNTFSWRYTPPLPVALVVTIVAGVLGSVALVHMEVRRHQHNAALQRFAVQRMRRKFKEAKKALLLQQQLQEQVEPENKIEVKSKVAWEIVRRRVNKCRSNNTNGKQLKGGSNQRKDAAKKIIRSTLGSSRKHKLKKL